MDRVPALVIFDESTARAFIAEYGNLSDNVQMTADVSSESFVMIDTRASKGDQWRESGKLDLAVYQMNLTVHFCASRCLAATRTFCAKGVYSW